MIDVEEIVSELRLRELQANRADRLIEGLGLRDVMMTDNLEYIFSRELYRRKVLGLWAQQPPAVWKGTVAVGPRSINMVASRKPGPLMLGWPPCWGRDGLFQLTMVRGFQPRRSHLFRFARAV